jgi:vanillate O-demethylase ferredoxin subunit
MSEIHTSVQTLPVVVTRVRQEAHGIRLFQVEPLGGATLPAFTAGSHIDVHLAPGLTRQYSLCGDPAERAFYEFAVQLEAASRGGSQALHQQVMAGSQLTISTPRNFFSLNSAAPRHLLLAGGIGVTPMVSMLHELERRGAAYELHYCTRSPERTAFRRRLLPAVEAGRVHLHHDGGDPAQGLAMGPLLLRQPAGTHLYYCGPSGFMAAVAQASTGWPREAVHCEYFVAPDKSATDTKDEPFVVKLARSGRCLEVPADRSIMDVLADHGVAVQSSCRAGYCGSCITRYVAGEPEHRDAVLDTSDRSQYVLVCCARSRSKELVLDL